MTRERSPKPDRYEVRRCFYCKKKLERGNFSDTCDRCEWWLTARTRDDDGRVGVESEDDLHELAEHSRHVFTRPKTALELELERDEAEARKYSERFPKRIEVKKRRSM